MHNSLATIAPEVAKYWDHSKNEKTPEEVLAGRRSRAEWKCPVCMHEWKAPIFLRVRRGAGCVCNSLESLFPSVAADFEIEQNGFAPSEVTAKSAKKVWWRTAKRGSWRQTVYERTVYERGQPVTRHVKPYRTPHNSG